MQLQRVVGVCCVLPHIEGNCGIIHAAVFGTELDFDQALGALYIKLTLAAGSQLIEFTYRVSREIGCQKLLYICCAVEAMQQPL